MDYEQLQPSRESYHHAKKRDHSFSIDYIHNYGLGRLLGETFSYYARPVSIRRDQLHTLSRMAETTPNVRPVKLC